MNKLDWFHRTICKMLVFFLVLLTASCAGEAVAYPRVWIDAPGDGSLVPLGTNIMVISHAYARQGIAEVVLSINGEAYRRDVPSTPGEEFVQLSQDWLPTEEGTYVVQVQTYDVAGQVSNSASITVRVGGLPTEVIPSPVEVISLTDTPTPVLTSTFTPVPIITATIVEQPVFVPTDTDTPEPEPPLDTSPPPAPSPAVPANGLTLSCRGSQNLVWLPVDDPSGIAGYYVALERRASTDASWTSTGGSGLTLDKQYTVNVECGWYYRWRVSAQDGAGNVSGWSGWSTFSVTLE